MRTTMKVDCDAGTDPEATHLLQHRVLRLTRREFLLGGAGLVLCGCATTPIPGRHQLMLVSAAQETALGAQAYRQTLQKEPVTHDPRLTEPVLRIAKRLEAVTEHPEFHWEANVIKDDRTANAFALPGGKIAVYTGLFPYAKNEAGLAAVMGHEVTHALARHGAERMSQGVLAQVGLTAAAVAMQAEQMNPATAQAAMAAL